ncbi:MAG TPA: LysM peptidoglycan-binding domain-containing protein [Opitutaceae bacterium]|jgi:LysM repeat protein|nr:LysM peptidoglycan-binding domain-containing protein [Opitutaceae bacterium]
MWKRPLCLSCALIAAAAARAQPASALDVANLQEDVRGLNQKVSDLTLRVEQLEHQAATAQSSAQAQSQHNYVTLEQLNAAVADLNRSVQGAVASSQSDTLDRVNVQIQKLVKQVNAALAGPAKGAAEASFSADFPKTGVSYAVAKGDTLALIAKKTGAKVQDIINANKLSDPGRIQVGQTLFIPGGK